MASFWWTSTSSTDPTVGANWTKSDGTTGAVPANGDNVYVVPIAGLTLASIGAADQHTIALASLTVSQGFAGTIGTSAAPGGYWRVGAAILNLGSPVLDQSSPQGSTRIKIDTGSTSAVVNVYNTGNATTSADIGFEPTRIIGSAITTINLYNGFFGVATNSPGETSTVGTVNVTGGTCDLGPGVTWTTGTAASNNGAAGVLNVASAGTTLTTSSGATATATGSGAITTVNAGGTTNLNNRSGGTDITTLNIYSTGTADFSGNPSASTVATLNLYGGGMWQTDPANPNHVTATTLHRVNCGTISGS